MGTLTNTLLAEIFAVVPDTQVTQDKVQLESLEFGSDQRVAYEHSAVGSGKSLVFVGCQVCWKDHLDFSCHNLS